jgi:uncharacterized membrane protein
MPNSFADTLNCFALMILFCALVFVIIYLLKILAEQRAFSADLLDEFLSLKSELKRLNRNLTTHRPAEKPTEQPVKAASKPAEPVAAPLVESLPIINESASPVPDVPALSQAPEKALPVARAIAKALPIQEQPQEAETLDHLAVGQRARKPRLREDEPVPEPTPSIVQETLRKIWNWIVLGDEQLPAGVSMEYAIASQWLLRIGILILVLGIAFFIKYSINNGLLNEYGRIGLSAVAGFAMIIAGTRLLGKQYHVFGQGLLGGGLATLYFAVYAAANFYKLIDQPVAFGLMSLITVLAGAIAVRFNSILVIVLGIIGGYGTPIVLSTGVVNFVGLNGYLLVLGIGVLGICYWKDWLLVNYLSFACTYALVLLSLQDYAPDKYWEVMPFLMAFFVLYSTMTFLYKLVNRQQSNLLDVLAAIINAFVFFGVAYFLTERLYGSLSVAWISGGLALFYSGHASDMVNRKLIDRGLLVTYIGLAALFTTLTIPIVVGDNWITSGWALFAVVLVWMAGMLGSEFLRTVAYLLFMVVLVRFGFWDLPRNFSATNADINPVLSDYLLKLLLRILHFGIPIGSVFGASWLINRQRFPSDPLIDAKTDTGAFVPSSIARIVGLILALGMGFVFLNLEFDRSFGEFYQPARLPAMTLLWLGLAAVVLLYAIQNQSEALSFVLLVILIGMFMKVLLVDLPSWGVSEQFLYAPPYSVRDALMRLVDFGTIIAFLSMGYFLLTPRKELKNFGSTLGFLALGALFVYTTLESNSFLREYLDGLRAGGISILWSMFALGLILRGIIRHDRVLRYLGLALFGVVIFKVFFFDLATLDQFYRIIAFIVLGILVLCGSFVYLKFRETFADQKPAV